MFLAPVEFTLIGFVRELFLSRSITIWYVRSTEHLAELLSKVAFTTVSLEIINATASHLTFDKFECGSPQPLTVSLCSFFASLKAHCRSPKPSASVVLGWIDAGATGKHAIREVAIQGSCDRDDIGLGVQGGRSNREAQREVAGHEPHCRGRGREVH